MFIQVVSEISFSFRRTKNVTFSHHFGTLKGHIFTYILLPTFFEPLFSDHFFRLSSVICCVRYIFLFNFSNYFKIKIHMRRPGFEPGTSCTPITRSTNATVQSYFGVYRILKRTYIWFFIECVYFAKKNNATRGTNNTVR